MGMLWFVSHKSLESLVPTGLLRLYTVMMLCAMHLRDPQSFRRTKLFFFFFTNEELRNGQKMRAAGAGVHS